MTPQKTQSSPRLSGIPKEAADEVRQMSQTIARLESRIRQLEGADYLTQRQAEAKYSPPVIARELAATGSSPLNVVTVGGRTILQAQPVTRRR